MTSAGEPTGVVFPRIDSVRSSTATGRAILAAATREVDTAASMAAAGETDWRRGYATHFRTLTRLEAQQHALQIAQAALASVHDSFEFAREHDTMPLDVAVGLPDVSGLKLHTARVRGGAPPSSLTLSVPYRGARLVDDALRTQLDSWVERGTVEESFRSALTAVQSNPEWLDLSDLTIVVLGAGAEMGPIQSLLGWGAHVVALDRPRPELWGRLITTARQSPGTLSFPVRVPTRDATTDDDLASTAGVDLVTELPEAMSWLRSIEGPFTLASYVYADGAEHVRVSVAVDAMTKVLLTERHDLSLAFLATPTDAYAVPFDVVEHSRAAYQRRSGWSVAASGLTSGRMFAEQYEEVVTNHGGDRFGICDALVAQQGPNYALAKRIQRWRATSARLTGHVVSTTVAPATRTRSVLRNRLLAAAYAGAPRFGLEVFNPSTSNTVMAAMLVHDLRSTTSSAQPDVPLPEPYRLFVDGAAHGGMWRTGFAPRSVLGTAVVLGMFTRT